MYEHRWACNPLTQQSIKMLFNDHSKNSYGKHCNVVFFEKTQQQQQTAPAIHLAVEK